MQATVKGILKQISDFKHMATKLQTYLEIIKNRLLIGLRRGDFLEFDGPYRDLLAVDCRQALDDIAQCPLPIFMGAIGGKERFKTRFP